VIAALTAALVAGGCGGKKTEDTGGEGGAQVGAGATHPCPPGATLLLAQAQFVKKMVEGKMRSVPAPARLQMFVRTENGWTEEILEDEGSNVLHKAMHFTPSVGDPGILTIGAEQALLKIWRRDGDAWKAETLWNPTFGGKFNRLRDFEVGDVTGDGQDDIVVATHDQGVVAVVSWNDGEWRAEELTRVKDTFVHEIELGDVDGDGILEIFTTPSNPNKLDGSVQPGQVDRWDYEGGAWKGAPVVELEKRHAKEVLCVTLSGEERPVLFASLEGEHLGGEGETQGDGTRIHLYRFDDAGNVTEHDVSGLPGDLCRFLTYGDTDGDGAKELIASTAKNGIWKLVPGDDPSAGWSRELIATGTSGFEHATYLYDFDGDGKVEIYVASDNENEMRCYWYEDGEYKKEVLGVLHETRPFTWNITAYMQ